MTKNFQNAAAAVRWHPHVVLLFGVVSIAQLVEVADSAVLGGVVEVVMEIPTVGHNIFFSIYTGIVDL